MTTLDRNDTNTYNHDPLPREGTTHRQVAENKNKGHGKPTIESELAHAPIEQFSQLLEDQREEGESNE